VDIPLMPDGVNVSIDAAADSDMVQWQAALDRLAVDPFANVQTPRTLRSRLFRR
jgi:hypothetical protein